MSRSNNRQRIVSGIVLGIIVVAGAFLPPLFHLLMLFSIAWTMHEFFEMSMGKDFRVERVLVTLAACMLYAGLVLVKCGYLKGATPLAIAALPVVVAMALPIWHKDRSMQGSVPYLFASLFYIGIPLALMPVLLYHGGSTADGLFVLAMLITVWVGDIGAYVLGSTLGQRQESIKIAPSVSPKKSLWGLVGSVLSCSALAVGLKYLGLFDFPVVHCVVVGVIASLAGLVGDLIESLWKRYFGVKDSGNLIPGHGGLYDRLDSVIFALPLISFYLAVFGLI